jgi:hypothetical protein
VILVALASIVTPGNLIASVIAGLIAGLYSVLVFRPTTKGFAWLIAWYFGSLVSFLYIARLGFLVASRPQEDVSYEIGRAIGGWLLFVLFAAFIATGAWVGVKLRVPR